MEDFFDSLSGKQAQKVIWVLSLIQEDALCELSKGLNRSLLKGENIDAKKLAQQYT